MAKRAPGKVPADPAPSQSFPLTPALIRDFLKEKEAASRTPQTLETYRRNLQLFSDFLPGEKTVTPAALPHWKDAMLREGYAAATINSRVSSVNSFYDYLGLRNWQIFDGARPAPIPAPSQDLTREEYIQLLQEARRQENLQLYLLVKTLACTDLTPSDMPLLTREAVDEGFVSGKRQGTSAPVPLPKELRRDLLDYARSHGIKTGPLFLNSSRNCHSRTVIMKMIATLASDIGLPPGKANPRNLRRMHQSTLARFQKEAEAWVASQYAQLLTAEEPQAAWTPSSPRP